MTDEERQLLTDTSMLACALAEHLTGSETRQESLAESIVLLRNRISRLVDQVQPQP